MSHEVPDFPRTTTTATTATATKATAAAAATATALGEEREREGEGEGEGETRPPPPPKRLPKKLIICCDGTWRNSESGIFSRTPLAWLWRGQEQTPTNVTRISRAIEPFDDQGRQQIIYYQAGVGSTGDLSARIWGGALGLGLATNIREAYSFLANNWVEGDEIFLVGFSRGAFTARSVGGLIGDLGLLTTEGQGYLVDIFEDWERAGQKGYRTLLGGAEDVDFPVKVGREDPKEYVREYRAALVELGFTREQVVPIKAIGVWETVGSLGIPVNPLLQRLGFPSVLRTYRLYNTDLGTNIENAFQALALDETRGAYRPTLWQKLPGVNTNLKQTWFPGVHSDVGGGHPDTGISTITLAWMLSQLSPFLTFTPKYIASAHAKNTRYLTHHKHVSPSALEYAASSIGNSSAGIHALLGVVPRSPGRYHVFNKRTLTIKPSVLLQNTHERVHVSVRSRVKTGGLNLRYRWGKYWPIAFGRTRTRRTYQVLDGDAEPGRARWKFEGTEDGRDVILGEDELGAFEREIFENHVSK